MNLFNITQKSNSLHDFAIKKAKAKRVKITSLYQGELKNVSNLLRGKCPFHKDLHTPNFYIYPETNTWCCFAGCGGGDSISFYMKLKGVDFKQAVKELSK